MQTDENVEFFSENKYYYNATLEWKYKIQQMKNMTIKMNKKFIGNIRKHLYLKFSDILYQKVIYPRKLVQDLYLKHLK